MPDHFGPSSMPHENYIWLPKHVQVNMVSHEQEVQMLNALFEERYLGVDSEWRPSLIKNDETRPALF